MKQICEFNPLCDVREVQTFGYLDLADIMRTGIIPSNLPASQLQFNGIEDPQSILGSPCDTFDAMRMMETISESESAQSAESE